MYQRLVRWSWNADSISETQDAIYSLVGLAAELTAMAEFQKNPGYANQWNGDWEVPAEMTDEWDWLEWAEVRVAKLGHTVTWQEHNNKDRGTCTVELSGHVKFPLLLGRDSQQWIETNLKEIK